nr:hypothetical protein [Tanacetum cinerariifolium]
FHVGGEVVVVRCGGCRGGDGVRSCDDGRGGDEVVVASVGLVLVVSAVGWSGGGRAAGVWCRSRGVGGSWCGSGGGGSGVMDGGAARGGE